MSKFERIISTTAAIMLTVVVTEMIALGSALGQTVGNDPEDLYEDEAIVCVDGTVKNESEDGLICHIYHPEKIGINDTMNQKLFDLNDSFDMKVK